MRLRDFILANVEPILQDWEVFARRADLTGKMDPAALRDHAHDMLLAIAYDMDSPQTLGEQASKSMGDRDAVEGSRSMADASRAHAVDRENSGFKLVDVVSEYRALRASVLRLWKSSTPGANAEDLEDVIRFDEAIDQSLAMATLSYTGVVERGRQMFLNILGHDLRNPLATIIMTASVLNESRSMDADNRDMLALIRDSAAEMNQLVNELIDLSRYEGHVELPLSPAPMDLGDLCRQVVAETRAAAADRPIEFSVSGDVTGQWDRARLRKAVSNLLVNAVQHGSGPVAVGVDGATRPMDSMIPAHVEELGRLGEPGGSCRTRKNRCPIDAGPPVTDISVTMSTVRVYTVTGVAPDGDPAEMAIIAESAAEARQSAETKGMRRVAVGAYHDMPTSCQLSDRPELAA